MIGFGRLNHNSDFSFLHVKNPVGDFSPTGFVEQPNFTIFEYKKDFHSSSSHEIRASEAAGVLATILGSHLNNYSSSPLSASG